MCVPSTSPSSIVADSFVCNLATHIRESRVLLSTSQYY
ncbi:hypothetical protein NSERUTF1_6493 [Nocardia seriolae]|nr:hypothetical protein NSERUTF1_6493 [Nocardia seriolae]